MELIELLGLKKQNLAVSGLQIDSTPLNYCLLIVIEIFIQNF